jgi:hypothetical protein
LPFIYLLEKEQRGLSRGVKIGNVSPPTVKNRAAHQRSKIVQPIKRSKIEEITVLPIKTVGIDKELRPY